MCRLAGPQPAAKPDQVQSREPGSSVRWHHVITAFTQALRPKTDEEN